MTKDDMQYMKMRLGTIESMLGQIHTLLSNISTAQNNINKDFIEWEIEKNEGTI